MWVSNYWAWNIVEYTCIQLLSLFSQRLLTANRRLFNELKIAALFINILHFVVFYTIAVSEASSKTKALVTAILFGILGIVLLLVSFLILLSKLCSNECKQNSFKFKKTLCFGVVMILSTTAYFIGGNLKNFIITHSHLKYVQYYSSSVSLVSIYLLVFGIFGFCVIPLIEKRVEDISKAYKNEEVKGDEHSFYTTLVKILGLLVDVDAWYTVMASLNIVLKSLCSIYIMITFWLACVFIIIALLIYLPFKIFSFNKKKCDCEKYCPRYTGLIFVIVLTLIIAVIYVFADNSESFDCGFISATLYKDNIVRLTFMLAVLPFSVLYFVFCFFVCLYKWAQEQNQQNITVLDQAWASMGTVSQLQALISSLINKIITYKSWLPVIQLCNNYGSKKKTQCTNEHNIV